MRPGSIYRHEAFYRSAETGRLEAKYLVLLAVTVGGDLVARLLTSRAHGRRERPPCYHGHPYPGFYLGVLGGALSMRSWVDLRYLDDFDAAEFRRGVDAKRLTSVGSVAARGLLELLDCVAGAEDTTRLQARAIRDALASLR